MSYLESIGLFSYKPYEVSEKSPQRKTENISNGWLWKTMPSTETVSSIVSAATYIFDSIRQIVNPQKIPGDSLFSTINHPANIGNTIILDNGEMGEECLCGIILDPNTNLHEFWLYDGCDEIIISEKKSNDRRFIRKVKELLNSMNIIGVNPYKFQRRFGKNTIPVLINDLFQTGELKFGKNSYKLQLEYDQPIFFREGRALERYLGWRYLFMPTPSEERSPRKNLERAFLAYLALSGPIVGIWVERNVASWNEIKQYYKYQPRNLKYRDFKTRETASSFTKNSFESAQKNLLCAASLFAGTVASAVSGNPAHLALSMLGCLPFAKADPFLSHDMQLQGMQSSTSSITTSEVGLFAHAVLSGAKTGIEDVIKTIRHPIDEILIPMSELTFDAIVLWAGVDFPVQAELYQNSFGRMSARLNHLKSLGHVISTNSWDRNVEMASAFSTSILVPGAIFKTAHMALQFYKFGVPLTSSPQRFRDLDHLTQPVTGIKNLLPDIRTIQNARMIYVLTEEGKLIVGHRYYPKEHFKGVDIDYRLTNDGAMAKLFHPELASFKTVYAAGEIGVHGGKISWINHFSGHYRPQPQGQTLARITEEAFIKEGFWEVKGKFDVSQNLIKHDGIFPIIELDKKPSIWGPAALLGTLSVQQMDGSKTTSDNASSLSERLSFLGIAGIQVAAGWHLAGHRESVAQTLQLANSFIQLIQEVHVTNDESLKNQALKAYENLFDRAISILIDEGSRAAPEYTSTKNSHSYFVKERERLNGLVDLIAYGKEGIIELQTLGLSPVNQNKIDHIVAVLNNVKESQRNYLENTKDHFRFISYMNEQSSLVSEWNDLARQDDGKDPWGDKEKEIYKAQDKVLNHFHTHETFLKEYSGKHNQIPVADDIKMIQGMWDRRQETIEIQWAIEEMNNLVAEKESLDADWSPNKRSAFNAHLQNSAYYLDAVANKYLKETQELTWMKIAFGESQANEMQGRISQNENSGIQNDNFGIFTGELYFNRMQQEISSLQIIKQSFNMMGSGGMGALSASLRDSCSGMKITVINAERLPDNFNENMIDDSFLETHIVEDYSFGRRCR